MQTEYISVMVEETVPSPEKSKSRFEFFSRIMLYVAILAGLYYSTPLSSIIPLEVGRKLLVSLALLISVLLFIIARLIDGKFSSVKSWLLPSALLVILVTAISSLLSSSSTMSLFGHGYEPDSLISIALLFFAGYITFSSSEKLSQLTRIIQIVTYSVPILFVLQLIKIFAPKVLMGLAQNTDVVIGKWNDFGILAAVGLIISLAMLEVGVLTRRQKFMSYVVLGTAILVLFATNFVHLWIAVAGVAIILFVYKLFKPRTVIFEGIEAVAQPKWKKLLSYSLFVFLLAVILAILGSAKSDGTPSKLTVFTESRFPKQTEVRPWKDSFNVYKTSLKENPVFGVGPNRYFTVWQKAKNEVVNRTPFWAVDFNNGIGTIPTFMTTTGVVGSITWLIFLALSISLIFKSLFGKTIEDSGEVRGYRVGIALSTLLLLVMAITYIPGSGILLLTFVMLGLLLAALSQSGVMMRRDSDTLNRPVIAFSSVLALIVIGILTITSLYFIVIRYRSIATFQRSVVTYSQTGDFMKSLPDLEKAIKISELDVYYREYVIQKLADLSNFLQQNSDKAPESVGSVFAAEYQKVIDAGNKAVEFDSGNYQNYLSQATAFEAAVPLGNQVGYDEAMKSYGKALELSPKNPLIYYRMARLDLVAKNDVKAADSLRKALELKPDYIDALYLVAQAQVDSGNTKEAVKTLEQTALLNPGNAGVLFQLGLIKYNTNDFAGAATAFNQAITIVPDFSNAKFYLGLSLYRLNRTGDAKALFADLLNADPNNEILKKVVGNLDAGRNPLSGLENTTQSPTPPLSE